MGCNSCGGGNKRAARQKVKKRDRQAIIIKRKARKNVKLR